MRPGRALPALALIAGGIAPTVCRELSEAFLNSAPAQLETLAIALREGDAAASARAAVAAAKNTNVQIGAQDVFWLSEGAYTGEVSVPV